MNKKYLLVIIPLLLIFSGLFIKDALNDREVKIIEKKKEEDAFEIKPIRVYLTIEAPYDEIKYSARLKNSDSVEDFLEYLRSDEDFFYEKVAYIYGTELDFINNSKAPQGFRWVLYRGSEDVTFKIGQTILDTQEDENKQYTLRLIQKQETQ